MDSLILKRDVITNSKCAEPFHPALNIYYYLATENKLDVRARFVRPLEDSLGKGGAPPPRSFLV